MPSSDAVAELLGVLMIGRLQLADALDVGLVELHRHAKAMALISVSLWAASAFDVEGGVGFGVAQALGFSTRRSPGPARISDRMKLVVPLMMPASHWMRLAARPSRSA